MTSWTWVGIGAPLLLTCSGDIPVAAGRRAAAAPGGQAMGAPGVADRRVRQRRQQQGRSVLRLPFPLGRELRRPGRWSWLEQEPHLQLRLVEVPGRDRFGKAA